METVPAEREAGDAGLPPLCLSKIPIDCPGQSDTLHVNMVHIKNPKGVNFSMKKKQCDLWEYVWFSSIVFAQLLKRLPIEEKEVLEIGCGGALCSLTCALVTKNTKILATDLVEDALTIAKKSALANGLIGDRIAFERRNWEKLDVFEEAKYDLVIGSDVLFYRGAAPYVAKVIKKSISAKGVAIVCDPIRLNVEDFVGCLEESSDFHVDIRQFSDAIDSQHIYNSISTEEEGGKAAFVQLKRAKLVLVKRKGGGERSIDSLGII